MATLTIRQLDDGVYDRLKERARASGRSLEAEVRTILGEESADLPAIVDDLASFHARMIAKHGYLPDSLESVRAIRR